MAGGSHLRPSNPKGSSQSHHPQHHTNTPSSSSSSAARKSRWDSSSSAPPNTTTITTNTTKAPSSDPKTSKPNNPKPSPKQRGLPPSPKVQPKPRTDHLSPGAPIPFPDLSVFGPPPPPAYGFHMLERRTIVLADSSVRSYFALPPDYQDFAPPLRPIDPTGRFLPGPGGLEFDRRFPPPGGLMSSPGGFNEHQGYCNSVGVAPMEGSMKRKYTGEEGKEEFWKQKQQLLQYGNPKGFPGVYPGELMAGTSGEDSRASKFMRIGGSYENSASLKHHEVDPDKLKKAFLNFAKMINENTSQRKNYLEDGKHGRLQCVACSRSSKDFPDTHSLVMHAYNSDNADLLVNHLGLHKALCVLMGWNHSKPPDNSKSYQLLPVDEAAANQEDLIIWPPVVMIHNTITGKSKDGRMEGLGNKVMDAKIRDLGFRDGKSKSLYGRDGHLGVTLIKFSGDQAGLKDAIRMSEFFEKENHGRKAWARLQPLTLGSKDDENNPHLVKFDEKTREKKRIFYGYLGTAGDMDKLDFETRKKVLIESQREYKSK